MEKNFVSIWFPYLSTDWFALGKPQLKDLPFVLRSPSHGRMMIKEVNAIAEIRGIFKGMVLADARAIFPDLTVMDERQYLVEKLLTRLAGWCIRFSPIVGVDLPDGLLLDSTGCSHLWGSDQLYVDEITKRLSNRGYDVRVAMAGTIGAAWAVARFGNGSKIVACGMHKEAMLDLPPESLRIETEVVERLHKLGLRRIRQFIQMPRSSLRRRFGPQFMLQLDRALGNEAETLTPVQIVPPYQERLPCLDPIVRADGIAIALQQLLESLCLRLRKEQKGLRSAVLKGYRVDGKIEQISIGTNRPSYHVNHLFKLFELKIQTIEPALGIELFVLEAQTVEDHDPKQEKMWEESGGLEDLRLSELIDRLTSKTNTISIHRYLPDEHHWPERSVKSVTSLQEKPSTSWQRDKQRPLQLLKIPESIDVTAPIPDYPPMLFRHHGRLHKIVRADGPERIEQQWWIQQGQHRDYYRVEDEEGHRYWLFRLGHYHDETYQWFIHGFFS